MGIKVGIGGSVSLNAVEVAFLDNWKLSVDGEVSDFTKFKDLNKRQAVGLKSAKGSASGSFTTVAGTDPKIGLLGGVMMETANDAMTDEPTTANQAKTVFTITDEDKRLISLDVAVVPVVKYGTVPVVQDPADYTINYAKGTITFAVSPGAEAVTITGEYITMALLPGFTKFSLDTSVKSFDSTVWVLANDANYGWKRIVGTIGEWSADVSGFLMDSSILDQIALSVSLPKHYAFVMDQTNMSSFIYGQGIMQSVETSDPAEDAATQDMKLISISTLYRSEENALWTAYQARQLVTLSLSPAVGDSLSGSALITKLNFTNETKAEAKFDFDFEVDGKLTVVIA